MTAGRLSLCLLSSRLTHLLLRAFGLLAVCLASETPHSCEPAGSPRSRAVRFGRQQKEKTFRVRTPAPATTTTILPDCGRGTSEPGVFFFEVPESVFRRRRQQLAFVGIANPRSHSLTITPFVLRSLVSGSGQR